MPGLPVVQTSSAAWASVGSMWSSALNTGWILDQSIGATGGFLANVSPASSGQGFYSTGDATAFYVAGRALRVIDTSTHYCEVLSSSSSTVAGTTTSTIVTITNVVSGTTTLSTGTLTSVAAAPLIPGITGNLGPYSTGTATFPSQRFVGAYGGIGHFVDASTRLGFSVLGTEVIAISTSAALMATDNVSDIGASGANRPRVAYLATALAIGTNPAAADAIRLPYTGQISSRNSANLGDVQIMRLDTIDATANVLYVGAGGMDSVRLNVPLKFSPDNTYDIGAGGANRPRNIFVAGAVAERTKAGVPGDTDVTNPTDGMLIVDTSNNKIMVRIGGVWKGVGVT